MKVSIVGMGAVGTEIVGHLMNAKEVTEIAAVDKDRGRAEAELWDFSHTTPFNSSGNPALVAGDYAATQGSRIVVVTAGAQFKVGESRDDLVRVNAGVVREVIGEVKRSSPEAIVITVTNPVDVMTQVMLRASGWRPERMLSAGTVLDSARLRRILGDHVRVDPKNIVAYMLGDHGATGFVPWSLCNVCGLELDAFCALNGLPPVDKAAVHQQTLDAGFRISERKGNTNHGIAASVFRIINAIVGNEHSVLPVGVLLRGEYGVKDLVMSVPCVIGREGVEKVLNYPFAPGELGEFHRSEQHLRGLLAQA